MTKNLAMMNKKELDEIIRLKRIQGIQNAIIKSGVNNQTAKLLEELI